jgi:glycosyltransferase involved in cell wall biosynthesis
MYINRENQPLVSVGIPTYNRPDGLRKTLECITQQTYTNLEIIVSDNCSPNLQVSKVIQSFAEVDHRIKHFRQSENIGAGNNFKFLLEKSSGEYFMWAADDDEWDKTYIQALLDLIQNDSRVSIAFSNLEVINPDGTLHESYKMRNCSKSFDPFTTDNKVIRIIKYITQPGFLGKAHLIYGLLNRELAYKNIHLINNLRGSDCLFVTSLLCHAKLKFDPNILYRVTVLPQDKKYVVNASKSSQFSLVNINQFPILFWIKNNINSIYNLLTNPIFETLTYKIIYIDIVVSSKCYNTVQIFILALYLVFFLLYENLVDFAKSIHSIFRMFISILKRKILSYL